MGSDLVAVDATQRADDRARSGPAAVSDGGGPVSRQHRRTPHRAARRDAGAICHSSSISSITSSRSASVVRSAADDSHRPGPVREPALRGRGQAWNRRLCSRTSWSSVALIRPSDARDWFDRSCCWRVRDAPGSERHPEGNPCSTGVTRRCSAPSLRGWLTANRTIRRWAMSWLPVAIRREVSRTGARRCIWNWSLTHRARCARCCFSSPGSSLDRHRAGVAPGLDRRPG